MMRNSQAATRGEEPRLQGDTDTGRDLNYPHDEHQLVPMPADERVDHRGQVLIPVHEQMKKLIRAGKDRRDRETKAQDLKGLIIVALGAGSGILI